MRSEIFQTNNDLVKVYEHINIFKQETTFLHLIDSLKIHLYFFLKQLAVCHKGF